MQTPSREEAGQSYLPPKDEEMSAKMRCKYDLVVQRLLLSEEVGLLFSKHVSRL